MIQTRKFFKFAALAAWVLSSSVFLGIRMFTNEAYADTAAEIKAKIDTRNKDIAKLQEEIRSYQKQIDALGSEAQSLSAAIKSLDLTRKKLETNISLTKNKIAAKNLELEQLEGQIGDKEAEITDDKRVILQAYTKINEAGKVSLPELILANSSISDLMDSLESLTILQKELYERIGSLRNAKEALETNKMASEKARAELVGLNKQLTSERAIVLATTKEQKDLLAETNRSEASYKKLLATKKAQEAAFQAEIQSYESQLNLLVNPDLIPETGKGVLEWPLDNVFITQYFGNTSFATANPQIYSGKGHTGIDFRASIGTPVKSSFSGIVQGMGNTDAIRGCYSYGKWVMVKHPNGLSTLYAHLSLQAVIIGQEVGTGQVIGYSGNTGYSTGPHLHFGVYATQGVKIQTFSNSTNCKGAVIPIADYKAYLNPLSFL